MFPFHCDVSVMSDRSTAVGAGGKAAVIVDNVPGMIIAAPTPMTTRHPMSVLVEPANAAAPEPTANPLKPARSTDGRNPTVSRASCRSQLVLVV
jgi:hypothetical protein